MTIGERLTKEVEKICICCVKALTLKTRITNAAFKWYSIHRYSTYSVLNAASRLPEQLRLGVVHLGGVEDLLSFHLVQVQDATELHGG